MAQFCTYLTRMVAPVAFREGDIIDAGSGVERRVIRVRDDGAVVDYEMGMSSWWVQADKARLLRRPVRVGDVLVLDRFGPDRRVVESVRGDWVHFADGGKVHFRGGIRFRHADGAPIEPPADVQVTRLDGSPTLSTERTVTVKRDVKRGELLSLNDTASSAPCGEALARALFRTDPRVVDVVERRSEFRAVTKTSQVTTLRNSGRPDVTVEQTVELREQELERAWFLAWEKDKSLASVKSEVIERAQEMVKLMGGQ